MSNKKTDFITETDIPDSSFLDFFSQGQNRKIAKSNLLAALGVTGTIVQEGAVGGTPVLDKAGSVNNIRNLEDGSGVKSSVSPENGITLNHNFSFDAVGASLMVDAAIQSPKFRSIIGGSGINVSIDGDQIQVAASGVPVTTKTVIINQLSDFPDAVLGVRTLVGSTDYFLTNDITTSDRFDASANDIVIRGSDSSVIAFTYTGTGDFFTIVDASFRFGRITLVALTGRVWNYSDSTGLNIFQFIDGTISGCDRVGLIAGPSSGVGAVQINNVAMFGVITDGVEFTGFIGAFVSLTNIGVMVSTGALFNLGTAVFGSFNVDDSLIDLVSAGTTFISGASGSANIAAGGLGVVLNTRERGIGTILSGVTPDDDLWRFLLNDEIRDSRIDGLLSLQGNSTATTIAASSSDGSNAVLVAGTWKVISTSQMTGTTAGRITSTGGKDVRLPINTSLSVEPASGGAILINAYIVVDGVVDVDSRRSTTAPSGNPTSITLSWQNTYANNEFTEIFVENTVNAVDILVSSATYTVN